MIQIDNLTYRIEGRLLFDGASASVPSNHKVGLVGRNGTGKTTLLRLLTGEIQPETGSVSIPRNARMGGVEQEAPGGDIAVVDCVLAGDRERTQLLARQEAATDAHEIAEIQMRLVDIDAHSAPARAAAILHGLGFESGEHTRPVAEFSGGWRMRIALASVLLSQPDILLLDEPTNYLDLEGTIWLENYIRRYPYTVVMVSHDRDLLNRVAGSILHLEHLKLTLYAGGYDRFERTRREKLELQTKMRTKQEAHRKHMQSFVDRFRYKAKKARMAQSRIKAIERMEPIAAVLEEAVTPFNFPEPEKALAPPLITLDNVSVGYEPGVPVLSGLDLRIDPDDRIGLLGVNGNGKSTFAKLISKRLQTMSGTMTRSSKIVVGYFAQHQLDELDASRTPYDYARDLMPDARDSQRRARLGQFGFGVEKADTKIDNLSGGEKARLLFALAVFHKPHILILDEPTNHLDVDSRQALVQALMEYEGAVILISHDRHLIETSADRLWIAARGTVRAYDGDLNDYRKYVLSGAKDAALEGVAPQGGEIESPRGSAQERRRQAAQRRERLKPLKKKIAEFEREIASAQKQIAALDVELADADLYERDPQGAKDAVRRHGDMKRTLEALEAQWLEATESYETQSIAAAGA